MLTLFYNGLILKTVIVLLTTKKLKLENGKESKTDVFVKMEMYLKVTKLTNV